MTPEEQAGDVCLRCGEPFETRNEGEPGYCDPCAQELIREKDQRIATLEQENRDLREEVNMEIVALEGEIASEVLAGNIVKENYAKGYQSALRWVAAALLKKKGKSE